jgi:hypothetical protein
MSRDILVRLRDNGAFEPIPSRRELPELHVDFDELTGGRPSCEEALEAALRRGERVALVGDSGSGKSSVTARVLGPLVETLAPLPVGVSIEEDDRVATEPGAFARHVVAEVAAWVHRSLPLADDSVPNVGGRLERSHRFSVGLEWLAGSQIGYELRQVTDLPSATASQAIERAADVLSAIRAHGLEPVLVLDDTDKWVRRTGAEEDALSRRRQGFFGPVVRLLSEELRVPAIVAVHPSYMAHSDYRASAAFLSTTITVPRLPGIDAVSKILDRRVILAGAGIEMPELGDIIDEPARALLFEHYQESPMSDIRRRILFAAHTALIRAVDMGDASLGRPHIAEALAEIAG